MKKRILIIAEAGVNHNGSVLLAKQMIDAAAAAKADAIKFQTFRTENIAVRNAPKAPYQKDTTNKNESQYDMLKKLELEGDVYKKLIQHCNKRKIMFLSSPFDIESIDLLTGLGIKIFKIPSGEITNLPYLRKIGSLKSKIILSTGMANLKEVKAAIDILISKGTRKDDITVLHCNTAYPTPPEDANLLAMAAIKKIFGVEVGYSDHTVGLEAPIAAAALGATVIEKHFTLDKNMPGPDHRASLEPDDLNNMVLAIRKTEKILGRSKKGVSASEIKNMRIARKSLVAIRPINRGEAFTDKNIGVKRPGTGLSPMKWDIVLGRKAKRNFKTDELIRL
jgi:N,N'-diacetyllegionaminate synthase